MALRDSFLKSLVATTVGACIVAMPRIGIADASNNASDSTFLSTYAGTGAPGRSIEREDRYRAQIAEPYGLAVDVNDNLFFSDYENNRIRKVDSTTGEVTTVAEVQAPQGLSLDTLGGLYVGSIQGVVWRITLESGAKVIAAGGGINRQSSGAATDAALDVPAAVEVGPKGNVYIADSGLHVIFRLSPSNGLLEVVAGVRGVPGYSGDGGPATSALLNSPSDVEVDDAENLYIAEAENQVIRRIDARDDTIRTISGTPTTKGFSNGGRDNVLFNWPRDILLVDDRRLLIADVFNHRVRELDLNTGNVSTLAGDGSDSHGGENVPAAQASLPFPASIASTSSGTLFVSSPRQHRIYKIGAKSYPPIPWWQSPWLWLAILSGLGVLIWGISEIRLRQLRSSSVLLEKEVARRTADLVRQNNIVENQAMQLGQLADSKDQMLERISHAFRTPLTLILGPLERVGELDLTNGERQYLSGVDRNASRLLRLVDQLLGLTALESGESAHTEAVDASAIVDQVLESFELLADELEITLAIGQADRLELQSTVDAIEKISVNLISNAIKYNGPGGHVTVSLQKQDEFGLISVADDGYGIAADRVQRIFDPFERAHDEAERIPGSGLGLAVVRELVESQGGLVTVDSRLGIGSKFQVALPLAKEPHGTVETFSSYESYAKSEVAALRFTREPLSGAVTKTDERDLPVALVVEDNVDMLSYLIDLLDDHYHCISADESSMAMDLARKEVPDIIISDIMLPGEDGHIICQKLKSDSRTSHIPVILLTALDEDDHRSRGFESKADDYVSKPFDEEELLQRMDNLLELRSILQERFSRDLRYDIVLPQGLNKEDGDLLLRMAKWVSKNYQDPSLDLRSMATAIGFSERQLQRKLRAMIGLTPSAFLRDYRLQRAHEKLSLGERPSTVAASCGFASHAHFTSCFSAQFGYTPSQARGKSRQDA